MMKTSVRSALAHSLLSANLVFLLQFLGTLVIVRLITPEEFGIYSVAAVVVALAQVFRDAGTSSFIVQVKEINSELLQSAFGIVLLAAGSIGVILWFSSQAIASFYKEPAIELVVKVLAVNFLITPFGSVTMACLRRELQFREIAIINVFSSVTSISVSCFLIWRGMGAVGLAYGSVSGTLITIGIALIFRPSYIPWGVSLKRWREILRFGSVTTSAAVIGHCNMASTDLLLGKLTGMEAVAFFNRAGTISRFFLNLIMQGLNPVLLPALSQMKREGTDAAQTVINIAVRLSGVVWPVFGVIAVLAEPLTVTLFGHQWLKSAELVPFLCATAAISTVYSSCYPLHTSRGRPHLNVTLESVSLVIKVTAICIAAPHGLIYVAYAWPLVALCGAITQQFVLSREIGLGAIQLLQPLIKNAILGLACGIAAFAAKFVIEILAGDNFPVVGTLMMSSLVAAITWISGLLILNHPLYEELKRVNDKVRTFLS